MKSGTADESLSLRNAAANSRVFVEGGERSLGNLRGEVVRKHV